MMGLGLMGAELPLGLLLQTKGIYPVMGLFSPSVVLAVPVALNLPPPEMEVQLSVIKELTERPVLQQFRLAEAVAEER